MSVLLFLCLKGDCGVLKKWVMSTELSCNMQFEPVSFTSAHGNLAAMKYRMRDAQVCTSASSVVLKQGLARDLVFQFCPGHLEASSFTCLRSVGKHNRVSFFSVLIGSYDSNLFIEHHWHSEPGLCDLIRQAASHRARIVFSKVNESNSGKAQLCTLYGQ